jgi:hypothetical protein
MQGPQYERWRDLCEQIATEQDAVRFSQLVEELLKELHQKEQRFKGGEAKGSSAAD